MITKSPVHSFSLKTLLLATMLPSFGASAAESLNKDASWRDWSIGQPYPVFMSADECHRRVQASGTTNIFDDPQGDEPPTLKAPQLVSSSRSSGGVSEDEEEKHYQNRPDSPDYQYTWRQKMTDQVDQNKIIFVEPIFNEKQFSLLRGSKKYPRYIPEIANRMGGNRLRPGFILSGAEKQSWEGEIHLFSPGEFFEGYVLTFPGGLYQRARVYIARDQARQLPYPLLISCAENETDDGINNEFISTTTGKIFTFSFR